MSKAGKLYYVLPYDKDLTQIINIIQKLEPIKINQIVEKISNEKKHLTMYESLKNNEKIMIFIYFFSLNKKKCPTNY